MKQPYTSLADFQDWELEAYAEGENLPNVAAFFQEHPDIFAQWQREEQLSRRLKGALHRFDCPSPERLRDYYWQELSDVEFQTISAHLARCPHCTTELASLRNFMGEELSTTHARPAFDLPLPDVRAFVEDLIERVHIVVATLVAPTIPKLAGITLRGEAPILRSDASTSLLFATDDMDISLLLQKATDGSLRLAGQLLADDTLGHGSVKLVPADSADSPQQSQVDDTGNFVVEELKLGVYQVVITLSDKVTVIPELTLA